MHEDTCHCLQPNRCCPGIKCTRSSGAPDVPPGEGYRGSSTKSATPLMSDFNTLQLDQVDELYRHHCRRSADSNSPTMAAAIANTVTASDANVCVNANHVYANFDHDSECRWIELELQ